MNLTKSKTIKSYPIRENSDILKILLKDRTSRKNIIWATASYEDMGEGYQVKDHIKDILIKNGAGQLIKPRVEKDNEEQTERTRGKGEVFTPTWIIKKKVDLIEKELSQLELEDHIAQRWLEITCGEGPYMTSRYDTVTGEYLDIEERVGFLDRKLQRISKEIESEEIWFSLALKAYQASYGYEYQGDSLLIARENLLNSFIDYYVAKFNHVPEIDKMEAVARIISYNVFQMDGLKYNLPMVEKIRTKKLDIQLNFLGDGEMEDQQMEMVVDEGEEAKVKNWLNDRMIKFKDLVENEGGIGSMKFDVVIGNPPYQGENVGDKTSPPAIYNFFMEESYKIGSKVCLITPARFLFNTGRTPKKWNRKMLSDQHLKVLSYESESSKVFSNTTIKGGVVITYRDKDRILGPISTFTAYSELNTILKKTEYDDSDKLSDITYSQAIYKFTDTMHKEKPETLDILSKGNESVVGTGVLNSLDKLIFWKNRPNDGNNYIKIAGLYEKARVYRWVRKEYINNPANLEKWKVLLPQANGSGTLGEVLSSPIIGKPLVGHTQTFISIGAFNTKEEAQACLKYIKTKFTRVLLGVLKATQHNPPRTWSKIPLQDFTMNSDIDWTKSIAEIDQQLYKKYGLDEEEINFIESNVKGME